MRRSPRRTRLRPILMTSSHRVGYSHGIGWGIGGETNARWRAWSSEGSVFRRSSRSFLSHDLCNVRGTVPRHADKRHRISMDTARAGW